MIASAGASKPCDATPAGVECELFQVWRLIACAITRADVLLNFPRHANVAGLRGRLLVK